MGHIVEKVLRERGHEIVAVIDNDADWQRFDGEFRQAEVAIDFSEPSAAVPNMFRAFEAKVPVVVGTTGWLDRLEEVREKCTAAQMPISTPTNVAASRITPRFQPRKMKIANGNAKIMSNIVISKSYKIFLLLS